MAELYRLYDLIVESEIPLVEADPLCGAVPADVRVRLGKLSMDPLAHPNTVRYGPGGAWWYSFPDAKRFLFNTLAGEFEISEGREIVLCASGEAESQIIRSYLLGTAFGALQIQRGRFPFHGGCVAIGGRALVLTGQQGSGKSTLTGVLVRQGYRFLADDVSALTLESGLPEVLPAYPQRKLCRDACIALRYDPDTLVRINEEREKYAVRCPEEWHGGRLPLGWIAEIVSGDAGAPSIQPVEGHSRLWLLLNNLYRPWLQNKMGIVPEKMKQLLAIAADIPIYRIFRPQGVDSAEEVAGLLLRRLLKGA